MTNRATLQYIYIYIQVYTCVYMYVSVTPMPSRGARALDETT